MKEMTEKQKARLFAQRRNENFCASTRLEGYDIAPVTLEGEALSARLDAQRRHYER
ncbi:MAG: YhfG family protein [Sodalis sp. (in: enterobacteria)]|uniref:YhfG family protein n=1 Tax=Sodalis sp. (in: enterobacteria) TaxID=1898979 RepID=UPI003F2D7E12